MPTLQKDGEVFVLDLGDTENRFHPDWLAEVHTALDEVEAAAGPKALVTTATGKFFSNGLDLDWLGTHADELSEYISAVQALLARYLAFPAPTVAAVQGHNFGGGAMLALAHDFRVMRADRGYFCLPEVDLGMPFTAGMTALVRSRLEKQTAHEAMTTGRRYGGVDAAAARIVDAVADEGEVLATALTIARPLTGKPAGAVGTIKAGIYAEVLTALRQPPL
ncbi:enoyl-CoA hydratase-related protein [Cryptosporangium arvum]|jgi:enoyl-CoA hydratase/carnithine racemase|uniref:Enoyl-CoA hydratase/carnithine racemase n=1 Tax=Cryptosporangium arvum DSM 44712 TaxID=927661 RepID=A0A011AC76_9ACTN|nr:enoyl-CoA hydratase-related protein [Cryptosporangium arvum]EXG79646.1 enoyl-CoA hydratase/carnithine racemase [Cryptosporangium arvum DSM 44712]